MFLDGKVFKLKCTNVVIVKIKGLLQFLSSPLFGNKTNDFDDISSCFSQELFLRNPSAFM